MDNVRPLAFLGDGGEMGALMRKKDWNTTVVGTPDTWPQSLRTSVNLLLNSQFPMFVWWGKDLTTFYNDSYRIIAGEKHPDLLGKSGRKGWAEIWKDLSPLVDSVFSGKATWSDDQLLYINRHGYIEETYFTFSYSPILDESGSVGGLFCACIETTEKVLASRKVQQSERHLRATILQSPVAMSILKGPSFVVEIANERICELWGHSQEEVLHRPVFDALPEVRHQGLEELLLQVYTTGQAFTASERPVQLLRQGKMETFYLNFVYEPFREADGTISGILAVGTDVTEQVVARRKVEESEATLQQRVAERTADLEEQKTFMANVLESSMDGIYALKAVRNAVGEITDFKYLFVNNHIAQLLNRKVQEVIGSNMLALIPENRSNGFFELFCKLLKTGETFRDETHFVAQNIDNWYRYVIVPIDKDTVVVSTEDITEKKAASIQMEEQRNLLDNILKNSSNGISVSRICRDDNGKVIDAITILANDAAIKYIGLPKEFYLSKRATEIEPHIIDSAYYQMCVKTLQTGEPFMTQYQMESTGRWLELTVSKLDDDHLIHVFTDVTPIKEAQLQLERTVEDLRRSNKNLEEFAYAASHDLKEPTRKIHVFADRLKASLGERLTENEKQYLQRMELASKRMSTLIDDLLTYSEVSQSAILAETVDMNQLMEQVLNDLDLQIEQKKATINVEQLFTITGHRRQLQQAFQNLIGNALKYSRPNVSPVINIQCKQVKGSDAGLQLNGEEQSKNYYQVTVKDNGIGFEQADAERIFNVFTRLHGMAEYKGTGVGLSIVRKVIENHNGFIWAESQPGEGATFKILLPVA
ncbi:PAS domain-containing protein [Flavisolibacter tropicus]|uniref:PAS domain-containing protein n=1 Tax=Flavisolibacter tropicus TaxID=1492898 RepID=UPI000831D1F0|nr:PAS domain-containing protein [Flavisolibacter tropicus]